MKNNTKSQILELKSLGLHRYASWALYDTPQSQVDNDETIRASQNKWPEYDINELSDLVNTDAMLLGLNAADRGVLDENGKPNEWLNFHDYRGRTHDAGITRMTKGNWFEGAYMTDIFKDLNLTNSGAVRSAVKAQPGIYNRSMELLDQELEIVKPQIIVIFGKPARESWQAAVNNGNITKPMDAKVFFVDHYSNQTSNENKRLRLQTPEINEAVAEMKAHRQFRK